MKLHYWGVRGSIPVPGATTVQIGGNTPCVSVELQDGNLIVIDAGTGIRNLGRHLMTQAGFAAGRGRATLLISHRHWDHIHGLPFFEPAYVAGNLFDVYGPAIAAGGSSPLDDNFVSLSYSPINFPVSYEAMKRVYRFHAVMADTPFEVATATIRPITLNHPGKTFGYVITDRTADDVGEATVKIAYLSDTGPWAEVLRPVSDRPTERSPESYYWSHVIPALENADLVIHDTFFEVGRYEERADWGHSTPAQALRVCRDAGAHHLHLFHFAPDMEDPAVDAMVRETREMAGSIAVAAAVEGMEVVLPARSARVTRDLSGRAI